MKAGPRRDALTSKLLLEYRHERVGGAKVEFRHGLEHVAGRDALPGALECLVVRVRRCLSATRFSNSEPTHTES